MKWLFLILLGGLLLTICAQGQPQAPDTLWSKTFGGADYDVGYSVQQTSDGGYIVAGLTQSSGAGGKDVYLIKTDSSGIEQWCNTFGGTENDEGRSVQVAPDGGFIIAGYTLSFGAGDEDVYLIKTDTAGLEQWHQTFGGDATDIGNCVELTNDGGYVIAGNTQSFGVAYYDIYLIKTDSSGIEQWHRTYGHNYYDYGKAVQQTSDGGYIIVGSSYSFGASYDVYLIKTDSNGNMQWERFFGGVGWDEGYDVAQTADGGYILVGATFSSADFDVYLIKTNCNGIEQWSRTFGGEGIDYGLSVEQAVDGGYIVSGLTQTDSLMDLEVYLLKIDISGNELWEECIGGENDDEGLSLKQTSEGGYIIAGTTTSFGAGNNDVYLIKIEAEDLIPQIPLDITLTPHNPPIQIPAGGGSFNFDLLIENHTDSTQVFDGWIYAVKPNGMICGPIFQSNLMMLLPFSSLCYNNLTQFVPANAPSGDYLYIANVGDFPRVMMDADTIEFAKLPGDEAPLHNFDWELMGWGGKEAGSVSSLERFDLLSVSPNPFNSKTSIKFELPEAGEVSLIVYDIEGKQVYRLFDGWKNPGVYEVEFNGEYFSSGIYLVRLIAGGMNETKKVVLIK
jgi:hypothetical protein